MGTEAEGADELGTSEGTSSDESSTEESSTEESSTDESSSSTDESSTTGDPSGPEMDPEEALDCWEPLVDGFMRDVWGTSTEQLLLATTQGVVRVEGDEITSIGSGGFNTVWAIDLDNGWLARDTGLVPLVGGALEPDVELGVYVEEIAGLGPADVWAGGLDQDDDVALLHFDGTAWTAVDPLQAFGSTSGYSASMVATANHLYLAAYDVGGRLAVWDGSTGSLAPTYPDDLDYAVRLSTRDGEHPLGWMVWCDISSCFYDAFELGERGWTSLPLPQFDDWTVETLDYHADSIGGLWGLVRSQAPGAETHLRVVRHHEGSWQRARVLSTASIFVVSDGVVIQNHRATSACLFGD